MLDTSRLFLFVTFTPSASSPLLWLALRVYPISICYLLSENTTIALSLCLFSTQNTFRSDRSMNELKIPLKKYPTLIKPSTKEGF